MNRNLVSLFFIFLLFNQTNSQELKFENITIEQGLSHNSVTCIYQDSEGYIWFGTEDGLNRYDGYSFTIFRSKIDDTVSITDNIIRSIFEDSKGNLWIITSTGSINKYNRQTGKFKQYLIDNQINISPLIIDATAKMFEDSEKNLWAYNWKVFKYLPEKDIFQEVDLKLDQPGLAYHFFYEDNDHLFWIGTNNGLYNYNWADGTYKCYKPQNIASDSAGNIIYTIAEDPGGIFWIGNSRGLYKFDKNQGKFLNHWQISNIQNTNIVFIDIPSIINDHPNLWMSWQTWNNNTVGISKLNKLTNSLTVYNFKDDKLVSPSDNVLVNMIEDKSGLIWVGTFMGGAFKFEKERKFTASMKGKTICAFLEDRNGYIWIATSKEGLYRYDEKTNTLLNIQKTSQYGPINTIIEDYKGSIWFGTYNGLFCISNPNKKSTSPTIELFLQNKIKTITEDRQHRLWIGCEGSLCILNPENGNKLFFQNDPNNPNSISNNSIESTLLDKSSGNIWIATWDGLNLVKFPEKEELTTNNVKFTVFKHNAGDTNTLSENKVISLCLDKKGTLWAGTYGGGLNSIEFNGSSPDNAKKYIIRNYKKEDGLPNNVIYGILADNDNNIWISTNEGMSVLNYQNRDFKNFNMDDGLQSNQFFWRAYYQSPSGKMYFGGVDGYNSFVPDSIKLNTYLPPVKITGFSIFNKLKVPGAKGSPLKIQIEETKEITIDHNQSVISFEYVALNFLAPHKTNYAFKMEGFDNDWQYVGNQRKATYTNLDPGTYTFRVKATNNDGIWNEEGTSIQLIIKPPFWLTWWFKIIVLTVIILILMAIYTIRVKTIRRRNKLLERLVEKRTRELKQSNDLLKIKSEELNETNTQLEERQQLIEEQSEELMAQKDVLVSFNLELQNLNATKDKFFSIIAHDIKNPFNTILGFSELFFYNISYWSDEKKIEMARNIYNSSQNLYALLENLLQWSRSQRGLIEFKPEQTGLNQQINSAISLFKDSAEAKNIDIRTDLSEPEIYVLADLHMLDTIIRNLISNAIKFTYPKGTILIKTEKIDNFAVVSVIDNGIGMPEHVREKLFSIEAHQSKSGTNDEKGSGLGLILVKDFIIKHCGEIWAESEEGKGSTFKFKLPLPQLN